uniref:NADH dehydrogenase [ubiquinone] 1 alpha subcomplex subunit 9, mitochondrial n=1 Tax=Phallusia mammillata TaxID=59560 RepID=A0A6F9DLD0_9ASCI|nr:NADH dehydrogenase [ubiquinone] 1 alpha subcomplex subunit 9, mitochondrial [Phallusia mammillata]
MRGIIVGRTHCISRDMSFSALRSTQVVLLPSNKFAEKQCRKMHSSELPQGRGGRSSFSGVSATVFGGYGFVGRAVTNHLGAVGSAVMLPYRGTFERVQRLRLMADLGQFQFRENFTINQTDDEIRELIEHSNCVVNLIGAREPFNFYTMDEVNLDWPKRLARLVAEKGDGTRLVHLTHLNCTQEMGRDMSCLLRQNYDAENAMREIYPETTIVRSSNIYGHGDYFTFLYLHKRMNTSLSKLGAFPLMYDAGRSTVIQPVFVSDVAEGITRILRHPDAPGHTFEFVGEGRYVLSDFIEFLFKCANTKSYLYDTIGPLDRSKATILQEAVHKLLELYFLRQTMPTPFIPRFLDFLMRQGGKKGMWMTFDHFKQLHLTDQTQGLPGLRELGIVPAETEEKIFDFVGCNVRSYQMIPGKIPRVRCK